ncbi:Protein of unknown function [Mucilaginibacter lappiensis]|uniref:DUF3823 domain-containing protein n=1 Tax=Mucilaginibacter lappiensis TaxID=354630 RepID=A0ABR6PSZ6_9SPHI|nr:DUF3823 domain-containing protein [Mucilaginibacter lappiensis]MBB6112693.1 hypothetical protein [Mucilaginibacter lappiensis]SIS05569.1 Protein of unknown function [Mucilaginibacter lappiensis]
MKKLISNFLVVAAILTISACTKIDNYDGPNASFQGNIISSAGGNLQTSSGSTQIKLQQIGWTTPQTIPSKFDGTFEDTKLFKSAYKVVPTGGAFWPVTDTIVVNIAQGTKHDFTVTPYIIIKNFTTSLSGTTLTLKYTITAPIAAGLPTIKDTQPYVNTTKLVGAGASIRDFSDVNAVTINKNFTDMSDADKSITLTVPNLLPGRTFFVRVGVRLSDSFNSSNFSEIVQIDVPK